MKPKGIDNDKDANKDGVARKPTKAYSANEAREALRQTLQALRQSVSAGRPLTLPTCRRLCQRRLGGHADLMTLKTLETIYRRHQPFRRGQKVIRPPRPMNDPHSPSKRHSP